MQITDQSNTNRIFLSADLSGSTEFKYGGTKIGTGEKSEKWQNVIKDFYTGLTKSFKQKCKGDDCELPLVWKTLGDEIIFTSSISRYKHAAILVRNFISSVKEFRDRLEQYPELNIKACGWVADFPFRNIQLNPLEWATIKSGSGMRSKQASRNKGTTNNLEAFDLDFVGPSMDLGFRLGKLAQIDKMPLSVELALLISESVESMEVTDIEFGFADLVELKGVKMDTFQLYPFIYASTVSKHQLVGLSKEERDLRLELNGLHESRRATAKDIKDLCKKYILCNNASIYEPYIPGCELFGRAVPSFIIDEIQRKETIARREKTELQDQQRGERENGKNMPKHKAETLDLETVNLGDNMNLTVDEATQRPLDT